MAILNQQVQVGLLLMIGGAFCFSSSGSDEHWVESNELGWVYKVSYGSLNADRTNYGCTSTTGSDAEAKIKAIKKCYDDREKTEIPKWIERLGNFAKLGWLLTGRPSCPGQGPGIGSLWKSDAGPGTCELKCPAAGQNECNSFSCKNFDKDGVTYKTCGWNNY